MKDCFSPGLFLTAVLGRAVGIGSFGESAAWAAQESTAATGQCLCWVTGRMLRCGSLAEHYAWGRIRPSLEFLATFASSVHLCSALEINLDAQIQPGVQVCPDCCQYQAVQQPSIAPGKAEPCGRMVTSLRPSPLLPELRRHPTWVRERRKHCQTRAPMGASAR